MRLGVFGGTFDPVHVGHLILAEQCREQGRLDLVVFIPAARPPHKPDHVITPFAQRVEMLALAIAGHHAFRIDELEKDRAGPSYTVDTLAELRQRHPGAELALLIGADSLRDFPTWYAPDRIVAQAELLVMARPGAALPPTTALAEEVGTSPAGGLRIRLVDVPLIGISSTDLRRRVREGKSIRYFVPRAVEMYIADKQLYQTPSG
jgi:nicotinate-nucleotide adenylyltransferase